MLRSIRSLILVATLAVLMLACNLAEAGCKHRRKSASCQSVAACGSPSTLSVAVYQAPHLQAVEAACATGQPPTATPHARTEVAPGPAQPTVSVVVQSDPYGFGHWLNAERARRGLRPLACDPGLCNDAAVNSSLGFGHHFMGRARRQNAGVGAGQTVWVMWVQSGAHASALFDPSVTAYGIAQVGNVWTFSAY